MQTFIFIHNQDILIDFINCGKFKNIGDLNYVFLGNGEIDKISNLENVIIARNYADNIEIFKNLTSFTGWYLLWKNKMITSDYINLFEYDVNLSNKIENSITETIKNEKVDVIGYVELNVHDNRFLNTRIWSNELINSVKNHYNIDILDFVNNLPNSKICSVTSNHTLSLNCFNEYMEWVSLLINDIILSNYSGHQVERAFVIFYLIKNKIHKILNNELHHFQFDSHGTQGFDKNFYLTNYRFLLE